MTYKSRLAILASGNGTNAEEIFKYFKRRGNFEVVMLLSNNPSAFVLERAKKYGIPSCVFTKQQFNDGDVLARLRESQVTHVVLAGFLWLMPSAILADFPDRIINIHPSLLPKYGGKGMYGMKVHEQVMLNREKETGITIHLVNAHYDEGKVLFQAACNVNPNDTIEMIASKVNQLEYQHYPEVIENWLSGESF